MDITAISDLHGYLPDLPGGDLLIVAGDLTARDQPEQYEDFCTWLMNQSYKKKIFIGGNHDNLLTESNPRVFGCHARRDFETNKPLELFEYLCDSGTEFAGLKIWGTPWSLWFNGINPKCAAFTGTEKELKQKYDLIPDDIDILISHGPPYGILDAIPNVYDGSVFHAGSHSLVDAVLRVQPRLLVCGHLHEQGGKSFNLGITNVINASYVDERYRPVNKPVHVIL